MNRWLTFIVCASLFVPPSFAADKDRATVIVVGAGLAGLSSAVTLTQAGVDVLVLEQAPRVGGKLYSPTFADISCNLGTQYLFPGISPLVDSYVKRLETQPLTRFGYLWKGKFDLVGENMPAGLVAPSQFKDAFEKALGQMRDDFKAAKVGKEFFFDALPVNDRWNQLEKMSCAEYLASYPPEVYDFINAELGAETGGEIKNLSAIVLVGWMGCEDPGRFLIKGGNQALAELMKEDIVKAGGRVLLEDGALAIEQTPELVKVQCNAGKAFRADYVVVATPADVAAQLVYNLSAKKKPFLEAIGYSPIAEIALHLKNFPNAGKLQAALIVGEDIDGFVNQTGPILGNPKEGTVICVTVTRPALLELSNDALLEKTCMVLRQVYSGFRPDSDYLASQFKRWQKGVVRWPPNSALKNQAALREPDGRLFFAGDYTGDPSLMSASWSGVRAAEDILKKLGKNSPKR
jgi:monoamine oxidase